MSLKKDEGMEDEWQGMDGNHRIGSHPSELELISRPEFYFLTRPHSLTLWKEQREGKNSSRENAKKEINGIIPTYVTWRRRVE